MKLCQGIINTTRNLVIRIGATINFAGILEGVWPVNNQTEMWSYDILSKALNMDILGVVSS